MAQFKCIVSGNIVEFDSAYDIDQMRRQILDYVELVDGVEVPVDTAMEYREKKQYKPRQKKYTGHSDAVAH